MSQPRRRKDAREDDSDAGETVASDSAPLFSETEVPRAREAATPRVPGKQPSPSRRRPARRHPDIEVARLLVKRGFLEQKAAVEALRLQKSRAQAGKPRLAFLKLLVSKGVLDPGRLDAAQDEIRRNTYICDACDARAVILAGSQTRAGACPRCGHEISVAAGGSGPAPPARELRPRAAHDKVTGEASSATEPWNPMEEDPGGLTSGKQAFGRYKLLEELGRGAMGVVYRARHLDLDKDVALKVLVTSEEGREGQVARFRREAAAVQKLRHDGIVAVHDFGSEGDVYYLTMDLIEGGDSLHRALKRREPQIPLRRRIEVLVEVTDAVAHAHERGVIHRDLKPANVLIKPDGHAVVVDFGLAKDEGDEGAELTRTHDRLGTPLFMAPEQIRRGAADVDVRADVWALGVMLFVCLTGRYPFRSRTVMDLYLRIMREPPDWEGTRYSAPDRGGLLQGREPRPSELDAGQISPGPFSGAESDEETEVASRTGPDGKLPATLPDRPAREPPGPIPPPFLAPPDLRGGEVPEPLRRVVECALQKDPDDRYGGAEALAADLRRWLEGRPVEARRPSALKRLREQLRRRKVLMWLSGLLAAAALALGGTTLGLIAWQGSQERADYSQALQVARTALAGLAEDEVAAAHALLERLPLETGPELLVRGTVRARALHFEEARADLERAEPLLADGPEREQVLRELSLVELVLGREQLGVAWAMRALQVSPRPELATVQRAAQAVFARVERGADPSELGVELGRVDAACQALQQGKDPPLELCAWRARCALLKADAAAAAALLPPRGEGEPLDLVLARAEVALKSMRTDLALAEAALQEARGRWRRLTPESPNEAGYFNLLGYKRKLRKATLEAARANLAAAITAPFFSVPRMYQGRLLLTQGADLQAAEVELRLAAAADPWHDEARGLLLAVVSVDPARLDEVAGLLETDLRHRPGQADPLLGLCALSLREGDWLEARTRLDRARTAAGEARFALWNALLFRLEKQQGPVPARALEGASQEDLNELARACLERKDDEAAGALLQVETRPAGGGGLGVLAQSTRQALLCRWHARQRRVEPALDALEAAVRQKPGRDGYEWRDPLAPMATPAFLKKLPELKLIEAQARFEALTQDLYRRRETVARLRPE